MRQTPVTLTASGVALAGTLTLPPAAPPRLAVIALHGSGPLDRDGNMRGQRIDVFNRLAEALAAAGVACLRWDQRGCARSRGDYLRHGLDELVGDAEAAIDLLMARGLGPVLALGHSAGTLLAAELGGRSRVAGTIQLCPFRSDVETLLMRQASAVGETLRATPGLRGALLRALSRLQGGPERAQARLIARLRASDAPVLRAAGQRLPARSLRDLLACDPAAIHARNQTPTLLIAAGADVQCPPEDAARIAADNPRAEAAVLPGLSHLLRDEPGPARGFAAYPEQLKRPMSPAVAATITAWLARF